MKNVKVILIGVALCATVFANARIEALGGDAGFWAGDRANADIFPGTLNDGNWIEFGGVEGDPTGSINWGDDAKWGFSFDSAGNTDWVNLSWAKNGMGLGIGFTSESKAYNAVAEVTNTSTATGTDHGFGVIADGCTNGGTSENGLWTDCTNAVAASEGADHSGFDLAWGKAMSFGELGVGYKTYTVGTGDASTNLWFNWRGDMSAWVFDGAKAGFSMTDDGAGTTGMNLAFDLYTHITPADGVDVLFGLGFKYGSTATDQIGTAASVGFMAESEDYAPAFDAGFTWDSNNDGAVDACTGGTSDGSEADVAACDLVGGAWGGFNAETFDCSSGNTVDEATCAAEGDTDLVGNAQVGTPASGDYEMAHDGTTMYLPTAILAVEAAMTDWATVRAFVRQNHQLSCDTDGSDCGVGNWTDAGFGVGFGWQAANGSSINLDMEVSNTLFVDPITTMGGWDTENNLANGAVTLSYTF